MLAIIIGVGISIATLVYMIMRSFKEDVNKNFEKHEKRFEKIF